MKYVKEHCKYLANKQVFVFRVYVPIKIKSNTLGFNSFRHFPRD